MNYNPIVIFRICKMDNSLKDSVEKARNRYLHEQASACLDKIKSILDSGKLLRHENEHLVVCHIINNGKERVKDFEGDVVISLDLLVFNKFAKDYLIRSGLVLVAIFHQQYHNCRCEIDDCGCQIVIGYKILLKL